MSLDPVAFSRSYVQMARTRLAPDAPESEPLKLEDSVSLQLAVAGRLPLQTGVPEDFLNPRARVVLVWNAAMAALQTGAAGTSGVPLAAVLAADAARSLVTPEQEAELGRAELASTLAESPLCQDPALLERAGQLFETVRTLGRRSDLELHVLEDDRPQAFNLFNHVFVTSGELRSCPEDDRAATTLAHEMGHAEARDTVAVLGLEAYGRELQEGYRVLSGEGCYDSRSFQNYMQRHNGPDRLRREAELAADRRSMEVVAGLGLDPEPALSFFADKPAGPLHPPGNVRVAVMREHLAGVVSHGR